MVACAELGTLKTFNSCEKSKIWISKSV